MLCRVCVRACVSGCGSTVWLRDGRIIGIGSEFRAAPQSASRVGGNRATASCAGLVLSFLVPICACCANPWEGTHTSALPKEMFAAVSYWRSGLVRVHPNPRAHHKRALTGVLLCCPCTSGVLLCCSCASCVLLCSSCVSVVQKDECPHASGIFVCTRTRGSSAPSAAPSLVRLSSCSLERSQVTCPRVNS